MMIIMTIGDDDDGGGGNDDDGNMYILPPCEIDIFHVMIIVEPFLNSWFQ